MGLLSLSNHIISHQVSDGRGSNTAVTSVGAQSHLCPWSGHKLSHAFQPEDCDCHGTEGSSYIRNVDPFIVLGGGGRLF